MDRFRVPCRSPRKDGSRDICRQFINGSCRFGQSCYYLHEFPTAPLQVQCRYFQKGGCWFGDRCRYLHGSQAGEGSSVSRRGSAPAVFHSAVPDRRGSEPSFSPPQASGHFNRRASEPLVTSGSVHQPSLARLTTGIAEEEEEELGTAEDVHHHGGEVEKHSVVTGSSCNMAALASGPACAEVQSSTSQAKSLVRSLPESAEQNAAALSNEQQLSGTFDLNKDVACGICMDKISEKSTPQERRYGILPNCSHAFCISCIVTWRKTKEFEEDVIKGCPQCRVKSAFYVPSKHWVAEGEEKASLIASFKERSSKLKCTFYMRHGCCPFKTECIYSHDFPAPPPTHRRRSNAARNTVEVLEDLEIDGFQLWSYIVALTLMDESDEDFPDFFND